MADIVYLGDDVDIHFSALDTQGQPIDITGATLLCDVKTGTDAPIACARFFVDDGPNGVCRARFSGAQTATFKPGATYSYDGRVLVQDAGGTQLHTIGSGSFRAAGTVTPTP